MVTILIRFSFFLNQFLMEVENKSLGGRIVI